MAMRIPFLNRSTILAVLVASAAALAPAGAAAETGGVASAPVGAPAPASAAVKGVALATWFGPGFYGQTTACGQTLTPAVVGVANRTLPCGTLVKLSLRGRGIVLPVIDRGPYAHNGAQWDLTSEAARQIGMTDTARIRTKVVGSVPNTPTLGSPPEPPTTPAASAAGGASAG
ncbi:MAG TPA: septal ring lytic transglycosylase RlpA family protein [Solirubrobacteraceae bacterium]|jgi:rare lipoprotein A|nr:septal ring lytic transglycosylase RlpA family protein [Solirubrobacteraceae bacterium]